MRVAIIGGGVAGIYASWQLSKSHEVTLYEGRSRLGGHTNTRLVDDAEGNQLSVDTGFIVCNENCYPHFYQFIDELGVALRDSDMSFAFYSDSDSFGYRGPRIKDFLPYKQSLFKPAFLNMVMERYRFNKAALQALENDDFGGKSLGEYLSQVQSSKFFISHYIVPLAAAIWSSPDVDILDFPADTFFTFFRNHGMLALRNFPQWQTVVGGSTSYVDAFLTQFTGSVRLGSPVVCVKRGERETTLLSEGNHEEVYDYVVFACHGDQVLPILKDASDEERALFSLWKYHRNHTVLHTDERLMPEPKNLWASWNYRRYAQQNDKSAPVSVTYFMNLLQGLQTKTNFFVSLNQSEMIDPEKILYDTWYSHPIFDQKSIGTQAAIAALNGKRRTSFCGSYLRYGFHEDAVWSAINAIDAVPAELLR